MKDCDHDFIMDIYLKNVFRLVLQIYLYQEVFESNTLSDCLETIRFSQSEDALLSNLHHLEEYDQKKKF